MNYSEHKMSADYDVLNACPSKSVKLLIATEYGLSSSKTAEIQMAIIKAMRCARHNKKEFTQEDIKWFWRLNVPSTYKRAVDYYKAEPLSFIKYLRDEWKAKRIDNNRYGHNSPNYKYSLTIYNNLNKFINETDPEIIIKNMPEKEILNKIKKCLIKDTQTFHDEYIARVERSTKAYYEKLPEYIGRAKQQVEELRKLYQESTCHYDTKEGYLQSVAFRKRLQKEQSKCSGLNAILSLYPTVGVYVEKYVKEAEETYLCDIGNVAERVKERNFNIELLKVETVSNDPKFFDMIITDGEKKMHARSIWAAENSDKVTAHYRFIITNCK